MAYSCPLHNWWSDYSPCPSCVTTITTNTIELPFNHVERYVSLLPLERVKWIRDEAMAALVADDDAEVHRLAGFILELTN